MCIAVLEQCLDKQNLGSKTKVLKKGIFAQNNEFHLIIYTCSFLGVPTFRKLIKYIAIYMGRKVSMEESMEGQLCTFDPIASLDWRTRERSMISSKV